MKSLIKIFVVLSLLSFYSCEDMLEPQLDGSLSEDGIWGNTVRAFGFLNNAYNNLPNGYNRISGAMLDAASDDAVCPDPVNAIHTFYNGNWSPFNTVDSAWELNYEGIRKVNTFLAKIDQVPLPRTSNALGTDESILRTRERMKGEAYFLRALFYFELLKRYGGVPLTDSILSPAEAVNLPRASADATFDFILNDCDSAMARLPRKYGASPVMVGYNDAKEIGRATSGAALALKARTLLYRASPLFNTNNDPTRWTEAAAAAQNVISYTLNADGTGGAVYSLNRFTSTVNMSDLFSTNAVLPLYHPEIIFSTQYYTNTSVEQWNAPISFGAKGMTNPTQNLVDAFPMRTGIPIHQPGSGYDPKQPLLNRDPRLAMTVLGNGMEFSVNDKSGNVQTFVNGTDGPGAYPNATQTGYYLRKFLMPLAVWDGRSVNVSRTWILFRLAEMHLNYAEARNEAIGPDAEVYQAIKALRMRAGLRPSDVQPGLSQEQMREVIRTERRIELAFEEHRFFDIRRWRLLDSASEREKILNIKGARISIDENGNWQYQTDHLVQERLFEDKMYLFPIPAAEMLKSNAIEQNPGWTR